MKKPFDAADFLISRASDDDGFRERLLAKSKETIEAEFGVTMAEDHEIHVHEETYTATHLVLPPRSKFTEAERKEAKTGAESIEFLRKTMHDPAPPLRSPALQGQRVPNIAATTEAVAKAGRESIRRGLDFLESTIDENGAWRCIRFNTADPGHPAAISRNLLSYRLTASSPWKIARKRAPRPSVLRPRRILSTPSNIPDCGAIIATCPGISTAPHYVHS